MTSRTTAARVTRASTSCGCGAQISTHSTKGAWMPAPYGAGTANYARCLRRDLQEAGETGLGGAARAREGRKAAADFDHPALRVHLMACTFHVIGAGLSGLAAAVRLAQRGARVVM